MTTIKNNNNKKTTHSLYIVGASREINCKKTDHFRSQQTTQWQIKLLTFKKTNLPIHFNEFLGNFSIFLTTIMCYTLHI